MTLITESYVRKLAQGKITINKSASAILKEEIAIDSKKTSFDVFLSHSIRDSEIILGVKKLLEAQSLTVYVDWIEDPTMDRTKVTADTAANLRIRMKQSKSMIYVHSDNSPDSKWMPWEIGYFDGIKSVIAILPVVKSATDSYSGQEFLGLYPYIDESNAYLFVNQGKAPRSSLGAVSADKLYREAKSWLREKAGVQ